jgi:LCP family protein required for cell wall assembly
MTERSDPDGAGHRAQRGRRSGHPPRRSRRLSTRQKVAGGLSIAVVAVLVAAVLGVYIQYRSDWDSIKRVDITNLVGKQPPKLTNAENILLIGSDTRSGQDGVGGEQAGCNCSDTLMVMHISPGHHAVTVMSIPRDTVVPIIECPANNGFPGEDAQPEGYYERINATLAAGGPACTFKAVEQETGIHLDHFMQLDFTGFEAVVNDLGGVNVCLPFAVNDPNSGLDLSAGEHHVDGTVALDFWREREDVGNGSDLERIQRDQYLMAALVQGMVHSDLLKSPTKIIDVVRDATSSMTTDTGLDENAMLQIAESLPGLNASDVTFVTAPNEPFPGDPDAEVQFEQPQADDLFYAIQHDTGSETSTPSPSPSASSAQLDVQPSQVSVDVENGSGISGIATQVGGDLTSAGFNVVGTGDAANFDYTNSIIEYAGSSDTAEVNTLKALVPDVQTEQNSELTPGTLDLIVGSSFTSLNSSPSSSSPSSSPSISNVASSDQDETLNANVNICSDQSVFDGPNAPNS